MLAEILPTPQDYLPRTKALGNKREALDVTRFLAKVICNMIGNKVQFTHLGCVSSILPLDWNASQNTITRIKIGSLILW